MKDKNDTPSMDKLILEGASLITPEYFPGFILRYFKSGIPKEVILEYIDNIANILEMKFPLHCLCLLIEAENIAYRTGNIKQQIWFSQRRSLIEGMIKSSSLPHLTYKAGDLIRDQYRVYFGARGGMGEVFFCVDEWRQRICALKMTLPDNPSSEHFIDEITVWLLVSGHPNIVSGYLSDNVNVDDRQLFVMEYVPGPIGGSASLATQMDIHKFPISKALDFSMQFCDGMIWVQKKLLNIVHRDISPDNILIDCNGVLKISDWGLVNADLLPDSPLTVTISGERITIAQNQRVRIKQNARIGKFIYGSPEQFKGENVTIRSDIYSFGCVLYELFTGCRIFNFSEPKELRKCNEITD